MTPVLNRRFGMRGFGANGVGQHSLGKPAAAYPGRVAADSDLIIAVDRQQTQLAIPMSPGDTSMTVVTPSAVVAYNLLSIDNEIVKTTGPAVGNVVPVSRGFDGTTPALHLASATVSGFVDAYHHNALVAEVEAIEGALGPNLSRIPSVPFLVSTTFDFPPQTPGGSLIVGNNVITLTPVPQGVNGSDTNHYLYIQGGTGTAEPALITGGTAVSGAASGTVIVNCANTHSGAWTIQSATSGIQEAIVFGTPRFDLYIPAGYHNLYGSVYLPSSAYARITGAGMGITILTPYQKTGNVITLEGNSSSFLDFGNMTLSRSGQPLGTSEVNLYVDNWSPQALIHDLSINFAYIGMALNGQPTMTNVWITDFTQYGINGVTYRCGGTWVNVLVGNNIYSGSGSSSPYAVNINGVYVDGWYCSECSFGGANTAVNITPSASTFSSNLFFENCIFERYNNNGLFVYVPVGSGCGLVKVDNCRFIARNQSGATARAIILQSDGGTPLVDGVTISNCYLACNEIGIDLGGVSNAAIVGNTIFGTDITTGYPPNTGIRLDTSQTSGNTPNLGVMICGNEIGYGAYGATTRTNADFHGGPIEYPINIDSATHARISITGNVLYGAMGGTVIQLSGIPTGLVIADNTGIDDISTASIASAATINFQAGAPTFNSFPFFTLTGSVGVAAVSGLWEGAKGVFLASSATPGVWTAGATIGNTFTPQTNVPVYWNFRNGKIWLK